MKYKLCGDVAILLLSSAERITPGESVKGEIDAPDGSKIKLFRHKDEMLHYAIVKNGAFAIPYDFLMPDTYSVKIIYGNNSATERRLS